MSWVSREGGSVVQACCPWPNMCSCKPPAPLVVSPDLGLDLGTSGDDWEQVLRRLLEAQR